MENPFWSADSLEELFAQVIIAAADHGKSPLGIHNREMMMGIHTSAITRAKQIVWDQLEEGQRKADEANADKVVKVERV